MTTLFARRTTRPKDPDVRLRVEAHRILDRARAGEAISEERITWALRVTGDLE